MHEILIYILTSGGKVGQATSIIMVSIRCISFHNHVIMMKSFSIKTEHEIPIYDHKLNGRHHKTMGEGQKKQ